MRRLLFSLSVLLLAATFAGCGPEKPPEVAEAERALPERIDFNLHIKPILSDRCFKCHGPDNNTREAELRLDTPEGAYAALKETKGAHAIVPGRPGRSEVFRRLVSDDPDYRMPPPESNLTITPEEIAYITKWIEQGAEYRTHWSFIPPEEPEVPEVKRAEWPKNEIDRFVLARLEEKGWQPSPEADRETLIRRVTLDLTGLPPTVREIDAFLADRAPDAYEKVVNRLLASPAYGERMALDWLDVARYADSHGYQDDGMRFMWPWRDWVIRAFNRNLPYDRFITWQLAGDLLPDPTQDQLLATAFNRNHLMSQEGGIVPEEYRVEYVADRTATVSKAFLGLGMECARCHDHKFDPVTQKEFYQFYAFFNNVNEAGQIPYSGEPSPTVILVDDSARSRLAPLRAHIRAGEAAADPADRRYDEGFRSWLADLEAGRLPRTVRTDDAAGRYGLDELRDGKLANAVRGGEPATLGGDVDRVPKSVPGRFGQGLELVGDSYVDVGDRIGQYERNQPFTIGLWFNVLEDSVSGPLFSRSGGLFNGNRGYDCVLRADRTLTASLNHVWPDNAIEIETLDPVPLRKWTHVVMTYDGSSRADGLKLYVNGLPAKVRVLADNLRKSIRHARGETNWHPLSNLRIGRRMDQTLDHVAVDEFRVFDRRLTPLEVASLQPGTDPLGRLLSVPAAKRTPRQTALLREYYVLTAAPGYRAAFEELTRLRGEENAYVTELPEVSVMRERRVPRTTYLLKRGAYDAPADPVEPGTPAVLGSFPEHLPKNRLGLAKWLVDPKNPLTARVTVNRFWQIYFGRGLVATPDDFGNQGAMPTHPQLLDWLALRFVRSGWNVKEFQRLIVTSATYRQSSTPTAKLLEEDPDNLLLARGPSFRLPAELIRDHALASSGLLVRTVGGPSVKPYQPAGLWEALATRNATKYEQDHGEALYRRSMYTVWKRTSPPPAMLSFDAAERNFCVLRRQRTNTPLQALVLMNDPQLVEASRLLAERMIRDGGAGAKERIDHGFRLLTSRRARPDELEILGRLYEAELADYRENADAARQLLAVGEHPRDEALPEAEVAALAVVASTIMNYDETVTKR